MRSIYRRACLLLAMVVTLLAASLSLTAATAGAQPAVAPNCSLADQRVDFATPGRATAIGLVKCDRAALVGLETILTYKSGPGKREKVGPKVRVICQATSCEKQTSGPRIAGKVYCVMTFAAYRAVAGGTIKYMLEEDCSDNTGRGWG